MLGSLDERRGQAPETAVLFGGFLKPMLGAIRITLFISKE